MTPTRPREAEIRANAEAYTHLEGIVNSILSPQSDQSLMSVLCSAIVVHVRDGHGNLMEYLSAAVFGIDSMPQYEHQPEPTWRSWLRDER